MAGRCGAGRMKSLSLSLSLSFFARARLDHGQRNPCLPVQTRHLIRPARVGQAGSDVLQVGVGDGNAVGDGGGHFGEGEGKKKRNARRDGRARASDRLSLPNPSFIPSLPAPPPTPPHHGPPGRPGPPPSGGPGRRHHPHALLLHRRGRGPHGRRRDPLPHGGRRAVRPGRLLPKSAAPFHHARQLRTAGGGQGLPEGVCGREKGRAGRAAGRRREGASPPPTHSDGRGIPLGRGGFPPAPDTRPVRLWGAGGLVPAL